MVDTDSSNWDDNEVIKPRKAKKKASRVADEGPVSAQQRPWRATRDIFAVNKLCSNRFTAALKLLSYCEWTKEMSDHDTQDGLIGPKVVQICRG